MIWLYMAVWLNGHDPLDYKIVAKVGPFETARQCQLVGVLSANAIQSKDDISNALGACTPRSKPAFVDFHSMWELYCEAYGKDDLCWLQHPSGNTIMIPWRNEK